MVRPSLLAELRALENKASQGGLTPREKARLVELRAVAGPRPPARGGYDVNAAAAALRESLVPGGLRSRPAPAPSPVSPHQDEPELAAADPFDAAPAQAIPGVAGPVAEIGFADATEAAEPIPEVELPPLGPGLDAGALAEDAPAPEASAGGPRWELGEVPAGGWDAEPAPGDPAGAAAVDFDPTAPWDPGAVAARWDAAQGPAAAAEVPPEPLGWDRPAPAIPEPSDDGGWTAGPDTGRHGAWRPPASAAPGRADGTSAWDLSGAASPAMVVPDETDAGTTAVWKASDVARLQAATAAARAAQARARPASPWADPEIMLLDELVTESEGSFSIPEEAAEPVESPAESAAGPLADLAEPAAEPLEALAEPAAEPETPPEVQAPEALAEVMPDVAPGALAKQAPDAYAAAAPEAQSPEDIPEVDAVEIVEEVQPGQAEPFLDAPSEPAAPQVPPLAEEIGAAPVPAPAVAQAEPEADAVPEILVSDLDVIEIGTEPVSCPPSREVKGTHRVVVHTVDGLTRRGTLQDPDLGGEVLTLQPQPSGPPEILVADRLRAVFFMLGPGEKPPAPEGTRVRVTFRDGRQVAGFSPDYDPAATGFFILPADTRTNTERIWVYRNAVRQVTVS